MGTTNSIDSAVEINAGWTLLIYVVLPWLPLYLGVRRLSQSTHWRGGWLFAWLCDISLFLYQYAAYISVAMFLWTCLIILSQGSIVFSKMMVQRSPQYYVRVSMPQYDAWSAVASAANQFSFNTFEAFQQQNSVTPRRLSSANVDILNGQKVQHVTHLTHSTQSPHHTTPSRRALQWQSAVQSTLTVAYHEGLSSTDNVLSASSLTDICRTERNILQNINCINAEAVHVDSFLPTIFDGDCRLKVSWESVLEALRSTDNTRFVQDYVTYDNVTSPLLLSYLEIGSCAREYTAAQFADVLNAQTVSDSLRVTYAENELSREEFSDLSKDTISLCILGCILAFVVSLFGLRNLFVCVMVFFSLFFAFVNAAAFLPLFHFHSLSVYNLVGAMVTVIYGCNLSLSYAASGRKERTHLEAHPTVPQMLKTYSKMIKPALLTTLYAETVLFALAAVTSLVAVRQFAVFTALSIASFFLAFHYLIIPVFLWTSWAVPPRWYVRSVAYLRDTLYRPLRERCCEWGLAQNRFIQHAHTLAEEHGMELETTRFSLSRSFSRSQRTRNERMSEVRGDSMRREESSRRGNNENNNNEGEANADINRSRNDSQAQRQDNDEESRSSSTTAAVSLRVIPAEEVQFVTEFNGQLISASGPVALGAEYDPRTVTHAQVISEEELATERERVREERRRQRRRSSAHSQASDASCVSAVSAASASVSVSAASDSVATGAAAGGNANTTDNNAVNNNPSAAINALDAQDDEYDNNSDDVDDYSDADNEIPANELQQDTNCFAGKRPLKILGGILSLCALALFLGTFFFSLVQAEMHTGITMRITPLVFSPSLSSSYTSLSHVNTRKYRESNTQRALTIALSLKSDFLRTHNASHSTLAQLASSLSPTRAPVRVPTMRPSLPPSLAPTLAQTGRETDTQSHIARRVLVCYGITPSHTDTHTDTLSFTHSDAESTPSFAASRFARYAQHGTLLQDLTALCDAVERERERLYVARHWEKERDCLADQLLTLSQSLPAKNNNLTLLTHYAASSYTAGSFVGYARNASVSQTTQPAHTTVLTAAAVPAWVCANFSLSVPLSGSVSKFVEQRECVNDDSTSLQSTLSQTQSLWESVVRTHGQKHADTEKVNVIVTSDAFVYPLLPQRERDALWRVCVTAIISLCVLLFLFSLCDAGLTLAGVLSVFSVCTVTLTIHTAVLSQHVDTLDCVAALCASILLLEHPIGLITEYIAARSYMDKQLTTRITHALSPALARAMKRSRRSLFTRTLLSLSVSLALSFTPWRLFTRLGSFVCIAAACSLLYSRFISPYLLAFSCRTRCCESVCYVEEEESDNENERDTERDAERESETNREGAMPVMPSVYSHPQPEALTNTRPSLQPPVPVSMPSMSAMPVPVPPSVSLAHSHSVGSASLPSLPSMYAQAHTQAHTEINTVNVMNTQRALSTQSSVYERQQSLANNAQSNVSTYNMYSSPPPPVNMTSPVGSSRSFMAPMSPPVPGPPVSASTPPQSMSRRVLHMSQQPVPGPPMSATPPQSMSRRVSHISQHAVPGPPMSVSTPPQSMSRRVPHVSQHSMLSSVNSPPHPRMPSSGPVPLSGSMYGSVYGSMPAPAPRAAPLPMPMPMPAQGSARYPVNNNSPVPVSMSAMPMPMSMPPSVYMNNTPAMNNNNMNMNNSMYNNMNMNMNSSVYMNNNSMGFYGNANNTLPHTASAQQVLPAYPSVSAQVPTGLPRYQGMNMNLNPQSQSQSQYYDPRNNSTNNFPPPPY